MGLIGPKRSVSRPRRAISSTGRHPSKKAASSPSWRATVLENLQAAEYRFGGKKIVAGPGDVVFIPSGVRHAEITYLTPAMRYLTIRTVEPGDEPCCCGEDRGPES